MHLLAFLAVVQASLQGAQAPVLEFPEAGLDDPAAYQGYATRFFRDARRNAFQVYLDGRSGRVVHLWADAANASASFTLRDTAGRPAPLAWGAPGARATTDGRGRVMRHRLTTAAGAVEIGWFVLGSMREERDFQYAGRHQRPYGDSSFVLPELTGLVESLERLPAGERARHLSLLGVPDLSRLRARLEPRARLERTDSTWIAVVEQDMLDGRNRMTLELSGRLRESTARLAGRVLSVRATAGAGLSLDVTVTTDAPALTPLDRGAIFNPAFQAYFAGQRRTFDSLTRAVPPADRVGDPRLAAFRRLDREVKALELLSSGEKLMAGLPNFATYFGRDMMMAALMLEPVAAVDLEEHVIASVLRKLAPSGDVSHEEALGGQAIREHAAEYSALIREWDALRLRDTAAATQRLARARALLGDLTAVRENYRMIDDDFQLAVLVDRYLARPDVAADRKRRFLTGAEPAGRTRLEGLVLNLGLVAQRARPYAEAPTPQNLVGFLFRDEEGWIPGSWRDSRAGYGNGRYAMDVNAVWVPQALEAMSRILPAVRALGLAVENPPPALAAYVRDPASLRAAAATWRGARRHFEVRVEPEAIRGHLDSMLAALPDPERDYWRRRLGQDPATTGPLSFLALALDSAGRPIPAVNTDPATDLFLNDDADRVRRGAADPAILLQWLDQFVRPYPVGLFVTGLGPVVVNDGYAAPAVRRRFAQDPYHSPRVVWGREVNLLFLGLARQLAAIRDSASGPPANPEAMQAYQAGLRRILTTTRRAVEASGLRHNELWSYRIERDTLYPVRYGSSSDIQLWNVTDLAVRFLLDSPARQ